MHESRLLLVSRRASFMVLIIQKIHLVNIIKQQIPALVYKISFLKNQDSSLNHVSTVFILVYKLVLHHHYFNDKMTRECQAAFLGRHKPFPVCVPFLRGCGLGQRERRSSGCCHSTVKAAFCSEPLAFTTERGEEECKLDYLLWTSCGLEYHPSKNSSHQNILRFLTKKTPENITQSILFENHQKMSHLNFVQFTLTCLVTL